MAPKKLVQLCGNFIDSVKEKCFSPCFPVEWNGVGIDSAERIFDGRYEQKPLIGDIKFHEKDLEDIIADSNRRYGTKPLQCRAIYCHQTSFEDEMWCLKKGKKKGGKASLWRKKGA